VPTSPVSEHLWARDIRWTRAANEVLKTYRLTRGPLREGWWEVTVEGGTSPYIVRIHSEWADDPQCSCLDAQRRANLSLGGYCKHVIAALLQERDLSYQLLEIFL
jgi:hypothetical protein